MGASELITGLAKVADRYDVLLCDIWGVIHNGRESFPQACEALIRFRAEHGPVVLISNAARPGQYLPPQLEGLNVPREAWSAAVTSGDATRIILAAHAPGPAWRIGSERQAPLYDGLGLDFAEAETAAFISAAGFRDEQTETAEDYRERFIGPVARGLPLICANPDLVVRHGDRLLPCAGALAQLYASMGGEVIMAGKPHAPIYALSIAEAEAILGHSVDRSRVLCIGDSAATDVKGANAQGLDVLFIGGGIHGDDTVGAHGLDAKAVQALLAKDGARATYAMAHLAW